MGAYELVFADDGLEVVKRDRGPALTRFLPLCLVSLFSMGLPIPFFFRTFERAENGDPVLPLPIVPKSEAWILHWTGFGVTGAGLEPLAHAWTNHR